MATLETPTPERIAHLQASFNEIFSKVSEANQRVDRSKFPGQEARLVAVSKLKPASDIVALYEAGVRHFGENYPQELVDKAAVLPSDINWHFIGSLQSNKCKMLASVPNLFAIETLSSSKAATLLSKSLSAVSPPPMNRLNVFLQVNTSQEESKSGLSPLSSSAASAPSELVELALHILKECPQLRLKGLMTIGSVESSALAKTGVSNPDFEKLVESRRLLLLALEEVEDEKVKRALEEMKRDGMELSMGMSDDFVQAIEQGSTNVRVGSSIFGARAPRT